MSRVQLEKRHYALFVLTLSYCSNALDRTTLSILQEPIRRAFDLTDGQLGTLAGIAFALPYSLTALPFGMAADRWNRKRLLVICLVAWSALTAVGGLTRTFTQFLLARIGVGATEPAAGPAAMSMIADLYPAKERATALAIFYLSVPVGLLVAFLVCSPIAQHHGWQAAMFVAGVPGLVVAVLLMLTVGEPRRGLAEGTAAQASSAPAPLRTSLRFMLGQSSLMHLLAGSSIIVFVISGVSTWIASLFIRIYGLPIGTIGPKIGIILASASILGTLAGGVVADRLARRDERWPLWLLAGMGILFLPITAGIALSPSPTVALVFCATYGLLSTSWAGPTYALAHGLVGVRMRGTVTAVLLITYNLIGYGLGPTFIGFVSDAFKPRFGAQSLRYAFVLIAVFALWACVHLVLALRNLKRDMARAASLSTAEQDGRASAAVGLPTRTAVGQGSSQPAPRRA